jgi:hypothetical protein
MRYLTLGEVVELQRQILAGHRGSLRVLYVIANCA